MALVVPLLTAGDTHVGYGAAASLYVDLPYCMRQACEISLFWVRALKSGKIVFPLFYIDIFQIHPSPNKTLGEEKEF